MSDQLTMFLARGREAQSAVDAIIRAQPGDPIRAVVPVRPPLTPHELAKLRRQARERVQAALWPTVRERGRRRGDEGFTSDDVRSWAIEKGLVIVPDPRDQKQRELSWIGPWLAKLARSGVILERRDTAGRPVERPSSRPQAHGNRQIVYLIPSPGENAP